MVACPGLLSASRRSVIRDDCIPSQRGEGAGAVGDGRVQANDSKALAATPYQPPAPITDLPYCYYYARVFENWPFLNCTFDLREKRKLNSDG